MQPRDDEEAGAHPSDALKAAVRANPTRAFEAILGESLIRKAGSKELVAHCPFHDDKHPSLRCNLDKQVWCCDPCGEGGDVFDLAMRVWKVDFVGAVKLLASVFVIGQNGRRSKAERKLLKTLRYEIRDVNGFLAATHVRHEYDDGSKDMPWEPIGTKPAELPLYGIDRTSFTPTVNASSSPRARKPATRSMIAKSQRSER
jgi:CHC2 zinc finger